jgi:exopolysaccharide biosynthesis polyprenyl glycosylphosphotransferase
MDTGRIGPRSTTGAKGSLATEMAAGGAAALTGPVAPVAPPGTNAGVHGELPLPAGEAPPRPVEHLRRLRPVHQLDRDYAAARDALLRRSLAVADMVAAACAVLASQMAWGHVLPTAALLAVPLVVLTGKLTGLYDRESLAIGRAPLAETPTLFQLATLNTLLVVVLVGAETRLNLNATAVLTFWAVLFVGAHAFRTLARTATRSLSSPERCLLIGTSEQAGRISQNFAADGSLNAEIVAVLPYGEFELDRPREDHFGEYILARGIERVIIGPGDAPDRMLETVRYFKEYEIKVSVISDLLEIVGSSVEYDEICGTTLLGVRDFGLSRSSTFLKRCFDVCGSAILIVLSIPLIAVLAAAIKITSPGPVIFRQTRVGRDGERFTMVKLRTMREGAEDDRDRLGIWNETDGLFKLRDDPRVTGVGRFLRRTSLDELPQLFNVLVGQMSLVGPRPLIVEEDEKVEGWRRRRLHLKPGMTGPWQIIGSTRVPMREMISMDYLYIVNWSVWSDLRILLQTIGHVIGRRGL